MEMRSMVRWIKRHWEEIPDKYKQNIKPDNEYSVNVKSLNADGHLVVLLVDRQKPSVYANYSFDEERFGVNRYGEIIWGFDSGCSCPCPWNDEYPGCYDVAKTWKEFKINLEDFDVDFEKDASEAFEEIRKSVELI